ncbi:hypothetical protein [Bradyrhizobium canariense]|nr:hypothetical protein [Bradyrhizobium canariense]
MTGLELPSLDELFRAMILIRKSGVSVQMIQCFKFALQQTSIGLI